MSLDTGNLIWLDLEMTGLDPNKDRILEIATVVTDGKLNLLAEGPVVAIHQSRECLASMDEWCQHQHRSSGLVERVVNSKYSVSQAENMTLEFVQLHVEKKRSPMCGNTICQDRRFLYNYMPTLEQFFHYRNLDVSVLKIIARSRYPEIAKRFRKKTKHQALSDIYDSIAEMKYYLANLFRET